MKIVMIVQVLTKNPLFLQFLMRKIKLRTFSYNRKGEKAKALLKSILKKNSQYSFAPSHRHVISMTWMQIILPNLYIHLFMSENLFVSKWALFRLFCPSRWLLNSLLFSVISISNIKHVKFYIYFALVSLYSKETNKNADKPSLFLKQTFNHCMDSQGDIE